MSDETTDEISTDDAGDDAARLTRSVDLSDQIATCVSRVDLEAANLLAINHQKIGNRQSR